MSQASTGLPPAAGRMAAARPANPSRTPLAPRFAQRAWDCPGSDTAGAVVRPRLALPRRMKADWRVRLRGVPASRLLMRPRFMAAAVSTCCRWASARPMERDRRRCMVRVPSDRVPSMPTRRRCVCPRTTVQPRVPGRLPARHVPCAARPARLPPQHLLAAPRQERVEQRHLRATPNQTAAKLAEHRGIKAGVGQLQPEQVSLRRSRTGQKAHLPAKTNPTSPAVSRAGQLQDPSAPRCRAWPRSAGASAWRSCRNAKRLRPTSFSPRNRLALDSSSPPCFDFQAWKVAFDIPGLARTGPAPPRPHRPP